jgi:uncharacterized delta-60 repeat protein
LERIKDFHFADLSSRIFSIAIQPDGKILTCGTGYSVSGTPDVQISRFNSNGVIDTSFGTAGMYSLDMNGNNDGCNSIFIQPDGKILFVGETIIGASAYILTGRLLTNGTLDTTYGNGGVFYTNFGLNLNINGWDNGVFAFQKSSGKIILFTSTTDFKSLIAQIQ